MSKDPADWVARKLADASADADPPGLQDWLAQDAAHRADFFALWELAHDPALLGALKELARDPQQAAATGPAPQNLARAQARRGFTWRVARPALAIAACLALAIILVWPGWSTRDDLPLQVATAPGHARTLTLSDGSVLDLNGATRIRVQMQPHRRQVVLESGEVFFSVAHDARRPFEITMGTTRVRVLGTVFNLARDGAVDQLSVYSGQVEIVQGASRRVLGKGAQVDVEDGRLGPSTRFDPQAGDWRQGWLQTSGISLPSLVERLNRAGPSHIELADPRLASLQVSGRFRVDQPGRTLTYFARLHGLHVQTRGDTIMVTKAVPAKDP